MAQIFVGLIAEGSTDYQFLIPIIKNTLLEIAYDCRGQVDTFVSAIKCDKGDSFNKYVLNAAQEGLEKYGISLLIVHADADNISPAEVYQNKINPARALLETKSEKTHCKNLVALIPVRETEAWMLADKSLLIKQIGTNKTEDDLKISGNPETFNNPKEKIEEAIRIGRESMTKRTRKSLQISELYGYLGESIEIESLKRFTSYQDFERNIRAELIRLNLLQP
jgi:hypothetical protein